MPTKSSQAILRAGAATIIALGVGVIATEASAQSVSAAQNQSSDMFARDRGVGVRERPRPDYEAIGIPAGGFVVFPKIQIDAEYNDNVFAVDTGKQEDFIFRVRPEIAAESDWSRHSIRGYARGNLSRNVDFDSENTNGWGVGGAGRLDVQRGASISAGADFAHTFEPRTSTNTAVTAAEPIEFDMTSAYLGAVRSKGRIRLSGRADVQSFDYEDGRSAAGAVIDQSDRNRDVFNLAGRIDYAISPATAVFGQVTSNERSYESGSTGGNPARDSSGYEALVGVNFELGAVSRGEIAAGYISQSFDDSAYTDIDGFGGRAQIEWFPTELTTVTGSVSRTIQDAGIIGAAGYLSSDIGARIDHELLRNLILTGQVSYNEEEYNGIDRNDQRLNASLAGTVLINRHYGVTTTLAYLDQNSDGALAGPSYGVVRLFVSLVAQF